MYVGAVLLVVLALVLAVLVSFDYRFGYSQFELKRRAKFEQHYKQLARFAVIYPGLKVLLFVDSLVIAVVICCLAWANWQFVGALIAFGATALAVLLGLALRRAVSSFIDKHLAWFNKYFGWTEILGRLYPKSDEPLIQSRQELVHIIEKSDFMDESGKNLVASALELPDKKLADIMIPRSKIVRVEARETLGPKLIDELHKSGQGVFPVVTKNLDSIIGTLCLDDITDINRSRTMNEMMRPRLPVVGENQSLIEALNTMVAQNVTAVLVVSDTGKTTGLVGLGDIVNYISG